MSSKKTFYLWIFLIAFTLIFTSAYSPFNFRLMYVDSSIFITVSQGIIKGYLPYRDLIDNKGPLLYLINIPGLKLAGFTGIWITELIFMFVSVLFAWKTALFFGSRFKALLGTIFSFIVLISFFQVNAGTEEYSLPFLMISIYLFVKYYFSQTRSISLIALIILGACFSCAVMIKQNMFPLWVCFCLMVFIESIIKKDYLNLLKYILGFCTGILIIFIPVFLYLKSSGILNNFWQIAIIGGVKRGFNADGLKELAINFYKIINNNYSFLPLFFGLYMIIKIFKKQNFIFWIGYTFSYAVMVLLLSFSDSYSHYNMSLIPWLVISLTVILGKLDFNFIKENIRNKIIVLFLCIVFSEGLVNYLYDLTKIFNDNTGDYLINAGKMIDSYTKPGDKIITLGFNGYIYPFTQRDIASAYFYQGSGLNYILGAQETFIKDILTNKPAIISLFTQEDGYFNQYMESWHKPIFKLINDEYRLLSDENGFELYIRNN